MTTKTLFTQDSKIIRRRTFCFMICMALALVFFSGCASFHSVKDAEDYLAKERTKNVTPKTDIKIGYTLPMDNGGNKALAVMGGMDLLYLPTLPLMGAKFVAMAAYAAAVGGSAQEKLWVIGTATTRYGRFVEYNRVLENDPSTHKITVFDRILNEVGAPPAPCEIVGKNFSYMDNTGTSRFKQTQKWCYDKEAKIFIGMSNYLAYGLFYRTALPEDYDGSINKEKVPICTKEMASEHFNKIVQAMEKIP